MNYRLVPNRKRRTSRLYTVHLAYLTSMQSTSWEMLGWKNHSLESRMLGEISVTSDVRWHHPYGRKRRGTKKPLDESERGEWKVGLKLNIQKTKTVASVPITSWDIDGETAETVSNFTFGGSKITRRRQWHPTPVLSPGKSHGWRSLVGCRPWGREELATIEQLPFHFSLSCIG